MGKLIAGIIGLVLTTGVLIWGLSVYAQPGRVVTFGTIKLPLVIFLLLMLLWYGADVERIIAGCAELAKVDRLANQLLAGEGPRAVLARQVREHPWAGDLQKGIAQDILREVPYRKTVETLLRTREPNLDVAALRYKEVADVVAGWCADLEKARGRAGTGTEEPLPRPTVAAVKVAGGTSVFGPLKTGDLIYSYDGALVTCLRELEAKAAATLPDQQVSVGVLRLVQKTCNHPLTGLGNTFLWEAYKVKVKGGPLKGKLEDVGEPEPPSPAGPAPSPTGRPAMGILVTGEEKPPLRFPCPSCRVVLKVPSRSLGKKLKCPRCAARVEVPAVPG